jgi:uncharacterized membrane protein
MTAAAMIAAIRPDDWDLPLFLHILGAMAMVGSLVTAVYYLFRSSRANSFEMLRTGSRWLIFGALPSFIVMRIGAQWIASKEGLEDSDAAWIGIGFITSDLGALLLIGSSIAAGIAVRKAALTERDGAALAQRWTQIIGWLMSFLVVLYVVAIWAMTTKPS